MKLIFHYSSNQRITLFAVKDYRVEGDGSVTVRTRFDGTLFMRATFEGWEVEQ